LIPFRDDFFGWTVSSGQPAFAGCFCDDIAGSDYAASPALRLPVTSTAADLVSMEIAGKRRDIEITADGWFVVAQYNARLAQKCSDPVLAEQFRQRARNAFQRLSMFELTPRPATTDLSGHRLGCRAN